MKPKRKDNFTDALEAIDRNATDDRVQTPADTTGKDRQEVTDNEGNLVTLGQKPSNRFPLSDKGRAVELPSGFLEDLKKTIDAAVEQTIAKWAQTLKNKSDEPRIRK